MNAARGRRPAAAVRLVVADARTEEVDVRPLAALPGLLAPGDVVVVNDAATLPASLAGHTRRGDAIEVRLAGERAPGLWTAVLFGPGDWRTPTERRAAPPAVAVGETLVLAGGLRARVVALDDEAPRRMVVLRLEAAWPALLTAGRPVQYSYLAGDLALGDVQTRYASRPWAVEPPSAGFALTGATLAALRRRGIGLAAVTHAAGLSSTGDDALDRRFPLPERYEVGPTAVRAVRGARAAGGRVIAVGTSVVRALAAASGDGVLRPGTGVTAVRIAPGAPLPADAVMSGLHQPGESHHALLAAFAGEELLRRALEAAERAGCLGHEFGDVLLVERPVSAVTAAA